MLHTILDRKLVNYRIGNQGTLRSESILNIAFSVIVKEMSVCLSLETLDSRVRVNPDLS